MRKPEGEFKDMSVSLDPLLSLEKSAVKPSKQASIDVVQKAEAYLKLYCQTGQERYLLVCERALEGLVEHSVEACLLEAKLAYELHLFPKCQSWLKRVLAKDPIHVEAMALLVRVCLAQGRYRDAESLCQNVILHGNHLVAAACVAAISMYSGKAMQAKELLSTVLQQDSALDMSDNDLSLESVLIAANLYWSIGDTRNAELYYLKVLDVEMPYQRCLVQYMDFLLEQNRAVEVISHLKDVTLSNAMQLRFALALKQAGESSWHEQAESLKKSFSLTSYLPTKTESVTRSSFERIPLHYLRECLLFSRLTNEMTVQVFELSKYNWDIQKCLQDAQLLLLLAMETGQWSQAENVIEWAKKNRIEDYQIVRSVRQGNAKL